MGLNDSYGNLIGQILLIEPFPSLSKVCYLVLQEEKRRNIGNTVNVVQQLDVVCTYCGFTGNIADKCYKLHRYTPSYKPKGGNKSMVNQVSGPFGFHNNNIGFPNVQSNVLPTLGVQSDGMIQNLVNAPLGAQTGFQNGVETHPLALHMVHLAVLLVVLFVAESSLISASMSYFSNSM